MSKTVRTTKQPVLESAATYTIKILLWLLRLMIPIQLGVTLLQYYGVMDLIACYLDSAFVLFGLPGESSVAYVACAMAGPYVGIATMMNMHLTMRQATILALMMCLCHALPVECAINQKTGSSGWKMAIVRIIASFVCAFLLNLVLPEIDGTYHYLGLKENQDFMHTMLGWAFSMLKLICITTCIIYILMVLQQIIINRGWLNPLSRFFAPLMQLFGLPRTASYMWLVGSILGISYGSAVMLELQEEGIVSRQDADDVNSHLIMSHSLLEDTIIFALTGISALLIIGIRLTFAMVYVRGRKAAKGIVKNAGVFRFNTH